MTQSNVEVSATRDVNYYQLIREWAEARGIIGVGGSTPVDQFAKGLSEAGEFWGHVAKGNAVSLAGMKDDIGDILVCVTNAAATAGIEIETLLDLSDITGSAGMVDFYKDYYDRIGLKRMGFKLLYSLGGIAAALENAADMTEAGDDVGFGNIDTDLLSSEFSDLVAVLTAVAAKEGWTIQDCLEQAYDDIRDRKGVMRAGVFIKEADITQDIIDAALADSSTSPLVVSYLKTVAANLA